MKKLDRLYVLAIFFFVFLSLLALNGCSSGDSDDDNTSASIFKTLGSWGIKMRMDSSGDIYVTGFAYGDVSADSGTSEADLFIAKYSSSGTRLWFRQTGSDDEDFVQDLAIAPSGNFFVAGYTSGTLGTTANQGNTDIFVMKYNSQGSQQWVRQYGSAGNDFGWGIATDSAENLYIVGNTDSVMTGSEVTNDYGVDLFLIKLDASGDLQWTKQLEREEAITVNTNSKTFGVAIVVDSSDDIIIGGVSNDGISGSNLGSYDLLLAKYDASGDQRWLKQFGTAQGDYLEDVQVSTSGQIYLTGYTFGTIEEDYDYSDYDESNVYSEAFLVKYDSSGVQQWIRQTGTAANDHGYAIAIDSSENIFVTGNTAGDLKDINEGSYDLFIIKYDASGDVLWEQQNGSSNLDSARGISSDASGDVYITGKTYGELDSQSNDNATFTAFISKYAGTDGSWDWTDLF